MIKEILFTHDDMDGAGCRIIFELAHIGYKKVTDYDVLNCSNTLIDFQVKERLSKEDINKDTIIFFADIVCSKEVLIELVDIYTVKIFDHHVTNIPAMQILETAVIIPENKFGIMESGTSLIYQYYSDIAASKKEEAQYCSPAFISNDKDGIVLSSLVFAIRSYDTYEWKSTNNMTAKKLQTLFFMLGMENFCNRYIERITENIIPSTDLIGKHDLEFIDAKLMQEQKTIDSITKECVVDCKIFDYNAAFLMFPVGANISEVAYQFLKKYPEYDVFASFTLARGGEFSFRTQREDINVGLLAERINGGGHPKASGAPVPESIKELFLNKLILAMNGIIDEE